ncbi:MAG: class I SAM-dependent methyltransferase [Actinomycetota bacterium]
MADDDPDPTTDGLNEHTPEALERAMSLDGDPAALSRYYADWAATYDRDVGIDAEDDYGLPGSMLATLDAAMAAVPALADPDLPILDAGCGTGRVGAALAARGYRVIDGIDLSPEMVSVAEGLGIYRRLEAGIDLTVSPPAAWRRTAALVTVGGVFTVGHIPPEALYTVAELVRPGGVLVLSVRSGYWDTTDFPAVAEAFVATGTAELLARFDALPYTADATGRYLAYRINDR